MSAKVSLPINCQSCFAGLAFNPRCDPIDPNGWGVNVRDLDPFLRFTEDRWFYFPVGPMSVSRIYGFIPSSDGVSKSAFLGRQPNTFPIKYYPSEYDLKHYGNYFRNLQTFYSTLSGRSFSTPSMSNEKPTRHVTFAGYLTTRQEDVPFSDETINFSIYSVDTRSTSHRAYDKCKVLSLNPITIDTLYESTISTSYCTDIRPLLNAFKSAPVVFAQEYPRRNPVIVTCQNFSFELNFTSLRIRYHVVVVSPTDYTYEWDSRLDVVLTAPTHDVFPLMGNDYVSKYQGSMTFQFSNFVYHSPGVFPYATSEVTVDLENNLLQLTIPTDLAVLDKYTLLDDVDFHKTINDMLDSFKHAVDISWLDIVPMAYLSSSDAFQSFEGSLNNNIIQTLAKIPNIANALPQIKEGLVIAGKILHEDFSLSTFKQIANLLTSTVLQANFEWRPYIEVFTKYLPGISSVMDAFSDTEKHPLSSYGSYSIKLNNEFGRKEVTLTCRTKMVVDTSPGGLLSALLSIDALGLLPRFSTGWSLIPLSFVADWFLRVGGMIKDLENSLFLATIPSYFVHTYTIESVLTDSELESLEISSSADDPLRLRLYYRDVSIYSPGPRPSRLPLGQPQGSPSLVTFGSLLYQLIFS